MLPARTFGPAGRSGLRVSTLAQHSRATDSVLSQASGRSANSARIASAGLNQCSGVTCQRSRSASVRPWAMHSSASCASCIEGSAKKHSLVATSGRPSWSASAIIPGSIARSAGMPKRCSSISVRSPNASFIAASRRSASSCWPSASSRPIGPRRPPVSSTSPPAWPNRVSSEMHGSAGSLRRKPSDDSRCRLSRPWPSRASSTTGSVGEPGLPARAASEIWQPMIGCTPLPAQYCENSSAPNRLPVSVIATAGICAARASAAISETRIAPWLSE